MKKFLILLILFPVISNAQFKNILKKSSETATGILNKNGKVDIAAGLKEALNKGITEQVSKLTQVDGFYKNELVKIVMPEELSKVDKTLRKLGMG